MVDDSMGIIKDHLAVSAEYLKINVKTFVEYRISFVLQVVFIFLNNVIWLIFWFFFFVNFPVVNGYVFTDMAMIYGIVAMAYGLSGIFSNNRKDLAEIINKGKLDYYLTLPKNVLFHLGTSGLSIFSIGDLIFGIIVLIIFGGSYPLWLIILFIITGVILLNGIGIIVGSIAFYIGNSERLSHTLHLSTIALSIYPIGIFGDYAKLILLTIFPVAFIGSIPLEVLKSFSLEGVLLIIGVALVVLAIAVIVFYYGLRRYESGNLIYVRN
jgi:ABC-2 type transport system permease protein